MYRNKEEREGMLNVKKERERERGGGWLGVDKKGLLCLSLEHSHCLTHESNGIYVERWQMNGDPRT